MKKNSIGNGNSDCVVSRCDRKCRRDRYNRCTVIEAAGTYNITASITNSTALYCIDIQSDDVIIDG